MEASTIASTTPLLLSTCMNIIKVLYSARPRLKPAPLTMTSVTNECFGLHQALARVQEVDFVSIEATGGSSSMQKAQSITACFLGCSMTISVVDEYAMALQAAIELEAPGDMTTANQNRICQLWKENDMKELLSQTRAYRISLLSLLESIELSVDGKTDAVVPKQSDVTDLLRRSQSSFKTQPGSSRSSLRESIPSLDPSPPYALSLYSYAEVLANVTVDASEDESQSTRSNAEQVDSWKVETRTNGEPVAEFLLQRRGSWSSRSQSRLPNLAEVPPAERMRPVSRIQESSHEEFIDSDSEIEDYNGSPGGWGTTLAGISKPLISVLNRPDDDGKDAIPPQKHSAEPTVSEARRETQNLPTANKVNLRNEHSAASDSQLPNTSTNNYEHDPYKSSYRLEAQAASVALLVTKDTPLSKSSMHPLLDEDGKLSSSGVATSLKYARAQNIPSYPSHGGVKMSSAGAAASLAESNQKSLEHWKPGSIPAANKAAILAKDYEMDPLWQPENSKSSFSAIGQATKPSDITSRNGGVDAHRKALLAATAAMSTGNRRRDSGWALKDATSSQISNLSGAGTLGDPRFENSRLQSMPKGSVNRAMYDSAPPVAIEAEEKNRNDMRRATAITMAQKMYALRRTIIEDTKKKESEEQTGTGDTHHHALSDFSSSSSEEAAPEPQQTFEGEARKLVQATLAKQLHDEQAEYRDYYGPKNPLKSRLTLRGRRQVSNDGKLLDDQEASHIIRTQMSMFKTNLAEVDSRKRQNDRDNLMAAAHRNVTARMNAMDEKIFQETGKQSPRQRELWEAEARRRAQADSDELMLSATNQMNSDRETLRHQARARED